MFRVRFTIHCLLGLSGLDTSVDDQEFAGNVQLNLSIEQAEVGAWNDNLFLDLPYSQQLSLLILPQCEVASESPGTPLKTIRPEMIKF